MSQRKYTDLNTNPLTVLLGHYSFSMVRHHIEKHMMINQFMYYQIAINISLKYTQDYWQQCMLKLLSTDMLMGAMVFGAKPSPK
jgi:hypothetical protein